MYLGLSREATAQEAPYLTVEGLTLFLREITGSRLDELGLGDELEVVLFRAAPFLAPSKRYSD